MLRWPLSTVSLESSARRQPDTLVQFLRENAVEKLMPTPEPEHVESYRCLFLLVEMSAGLVRIVPFPQHGRLALDAGGTVQFGQDRRHFLKKHHQRGAGTGK
jgi:hypothetical protein